MHLMPTETDLDSGLLAACRAGFERELAAEFRKAELNDVESAPGFVLARGTNAQLACAMSQEFVFARQLVSVSACPIALSGKDRVSPLVTAALAHLDAHGLRAACGFRLEFPDTNEGKAVSRLAAVLEPRVLAALAGMRCVDTEDPHAVMLHAFVAPDGRAWLGHTRPGESPWRNGIPRLRMPRGAPSRSTLKLAEAFEVFLGDGQVRAVRAGMCAVDLGAAPGGWTWQFVHRGVFVTAVDNGPLKGDVAANALVKHRKVDGFRYAPRRSVDWMVCDMVEKPYRVAQLVARWMSEQWCSACVFNLKLPMKKRLEEVEKCRTTIDAAMRASGRRFELRVRQLYHDRAEVTGFCRYLPRQR
jgi:23S rRNA (cytidine2498-2'-O)-methyltransferase